MSDGTQSDVDEATPKGLTKVIIAPSASEKKDVKSGRCRTRRERPPRLKIAKSKNQDVTDAHQSSCVYEADIESFASGCIPGVSFVSGAAEDADGMQQELPQRRTKLIHKRPLPLLSYLSSTHLSTAKMNRRKEVQERQNALAEEEAKKALLLNPIGAALEGGDVLDSETKLSPSTDVNVGEGKEQSTQQRADPITTTTIENQSNILMPPLLKDYLRKHVEKK